MLIRKCASCGREIQVSLPYSYKYVYYGTPRRWYCADCFAGISASHIIRGDWHKKTEAFVLQEVSKDNIDRLFKTHYNLSLVPQYIYVKLDSIYKGTYKGIAQPIPPHELLDILERKQNYIDKQLAIKGLKDTPAVNYALAVAVGSYKSYKEWLAKCAAEKEQAKLKEKERSATPWEFRSLHGYVPPEENDSSKDDDYVDLYVE